MTIQTTRPAHVALSMTEELECAGYGVKSEALATAWDRFCRHHDRSRFNAEVLAIKSCALADFIEHSREARRGA